MKSATLFFLLLCLPGLPAAAQFGRTPKTAPPGSWNIGRRSDGVWTEKGSSGAVTPIKIDPATSSLAVYQTLSGLRSFTATAGAAPAVVNLTDKGKQGFFMLDAADSSTPDNTGRVIVTASGLRYKRVISGAHFALDWYGAAGDNSANDTAPVQAAVNDALLAASPAANGELPLYYGLPGTLLVPVGTYRVSGVTVNGSIRVIGQGGGTYAGSTFVQHTVGTNMFLLGPANDGNSQSTVFEGITFKSISGTSDGSVAQIKTQTGIASNSVYIRNCWFKTPENYAIWFTQGDDIQITGCTFDVGAFNGIRLGTIGGGTVSNCSITNNTFYQFAVTHIKLDNVRGLTINNNRIYNSGGTEIAGATFVDGTSATAINGLTITGNQYNSVPNFCKIPTNANAVVISGNTGYLTSGYFLSLTGGGILYGASITGNSASALVAGWSSAPINGVGCGLSGCTITGNSFLSAGANTALAINLPDTRLSENFIKNNATPGFLQPDNLLDPIANGQGLSVFGRVSVVTTGWATGTYNTLVTPGNLPAGTYLLSLRLAKSGVDEVRSVYVVTVDITATGSAQPADLSPIGSMAYSGSGTGFKVRQKLSNGLSGVEVTINNSALSGGTLNYHFSPLL